MEYSERDCWLWLTLAFGSANSHKWGVMSHYSSVTDAYNKISSGDFTYVLPNDIRTVRSANIAQAQKLAELCEKKEIGICTFSDGLYPQRLKEIYNPPAVIFYKGDISGIDDNVVITVVGTRRPSEYSVDVGTKICVGLAERGAVIASGFAVGLDSVAHKSAMMAGGRTIAVLPCGISYDYPKENACAKETVLAKGGALISEYPPDSKPSPLSFRARNRILSGISLGTLIIQCSINGGPLSTASFALSQGRDIFCVPPHELFNDEYSGVTGLLRDGAKPVFDVDDVIDEYSGLYPHKLKPSNEIKPLPPLRSGRPRIQRKKGLSEDRPSVDIFKTTEFSPDAVVYGDPDSLFGTKRMIYEFIKEKGEVHLDELAVGIADIYELEAFLTELELDGLVDSLPGNRFKVKVSK